MKYSFRILFVSLLIWAALAAPLTASVIFKPGEKAKYKAPGEDEMSGNAQQLFERAQAAERSGNLGAAIKAYRTYRKETSERYPRARILLSAGAIAQEQTHKYLLAAESYAVLCEKYSKSEQFEESVEAMFRIGEMYLNGQKTKILGITVKSGMDQAADIFTMIIRTAPYGKYTARAQFDLGRAREKAKPERLGHRGLSVGGGKIPERSNRGRCAISNRVYLVESFHERDLRSGGGEQCENGLRGLSGPLSEQ